MAQQNQTKPKSSQPKLKQIASPCSPWTEPFQAAQAMDNATANTAGSTDSSESAAAERQQATQRPSDAEALRPTQDALSTIFNGG